MPTCPKCLHNFHRGAESLCPHCGFSLENLDKKYGRDSIPYRRVCDNAGALRQQDRVKLNALLEKLERRIPPVLLSVYFPNILEPFSLIPHSFWMMNHLTVDEAGFPNHQGPLDPQWLLVLVLDVRTDTACFMWGYELDPYVEPDLINKSIMKARIPLRESMLLHAAGSIMKDARPSGGPEGAFQSQASHEVRPYAATSAGKERRRCGMKKLLPAALVPHGGPDGPRPGTSPPEMVFQRPAVPDEGDMVGNPRPRPSPRGGQPFPRFPPLRKRLRTRIPPPWTPFRKISRM